MYQSRAAHTQPSCVAARAVPRVAASSVLALFIAALVLVSPAHATPRSVVSDPALCETVEAPDDAVAQIASIRWTCVTVGDDAPEVEDAPVVATPVITDPVVLPASIRWTVVPPLTADVPAAVASSIRWTAVP